MDTFAAPVPARPHMPGLVAAVVALAVAFPLGFGTAKWTTDSSSKPPVVSAPVSQGPSPAGLSTSPCRIGPC